MANEKKLIYADDARRAMLEADPKLAYCIERIKGVDAVEVVRCKDCKHWLKDVVGCTNFVGRCKWANYMVGATGYCVYGERKDNEQT